MQGQGIPISATVLGSHIPLGTELSYTRDRGSTRSASARRRESDRFESKSDTAL